MPELPSEFASSLSVLIWSSNSFEIMSLTRNVFNSRIALCQLCDHITRPPARMGGNGLEGRYQKGLFFQTGGLLHSRTGRAFAVYTTACTLPFIIRENVLRCSPRERNPLNYPVNRPLSYFQNFGYLKKKKISLISCLSGCGICKFCFKDSMPQKCINAWKIVLKIFIVGWRVTRLMSTGNLLKLLCVVQGARFFREKKWSLSAHMSGIVSCCQEVNLHLFTHLFLLP